MDSIALTAGYYLMARLGMRQLAELPPEELFDVGRIEVKDGLISRIDNPAVKIQESLH